MPDLLEHQPVEQLAGPAHERQALRSSSAPGPSPTNMRSASGRPCRTRPGCGRSASLHRVQVGRLLGDAARGPWARTIRRLLGRARHAIGPRRPSDRCDRADRAASSTWSIRHVDRAGRGGDERRRRRRGCGRATSAPAPGRRGRSGRRAGSSRLSSDRVGDDHADRGVARTTPRPCRRAAAALAARSSTDVQHVAERVDGHQRGDDHVLVADHRGAEAAGPAPARDPATWRPWRPVPAPTGPSATSDVGDAASHAA